jgi:RNA polymerase sigma-70 factor (ECF subfamily)
MVAAPVPPLPSLVAFRSYLCVLARAGLARRFQGKLDPSDVVQETLLEAHRGLAEFRGRTPGELAAWLRAILARNLADAGRALQLAKRAVARERSLETELDESSLRLGSVLAVEQPSPSQAAARAEELLRLAEALEALPEDEREAIVLRYLQGATLAEIGERLDVSRKVAARILESGHRALRARLKPGQG